MRHNFPMVQKLKRPGHRGRKLMEGRAIWTTFLCLEWCSSIHVVLPAGVEGDVRVVSEGEQVRDEDPGAMEGEGIMGQGYVVREPYGE